MLFTSSVYIALSLRRSCDMSGVHSAWSYPAPPPRQRNYRPSPFQNQVPSHDQYPSRNWSSMFQDPALPMGPIPRRQPSWTITGDQASSEREASTSIKSEAETAILEEEDAGGWVSGFPQRDKWARQPVPTNQVYQSVAGVLVIGLTPAHSQVFAIRLHIVLRHLSRK